MEAEDGIPPRGDTAGAPFFVTELAGAELVVVLAIADELLFGDPEFRKRKPWLIPRL